MIDMLDMTDQQLNRAIAELMGYRVVNLNPEWWRNQAYWVLNEPLEGRQHIGKGTEDEAWCEVPDYCNDPAASLEVQAKAIEVDAEGYVNKLTTIVDACIFWSSDCCMDPIGVTWLMTATPRERAEAAYMTLSSRV